MQKPIHSPKIIGPAELSDYTEIKLSTPPGAGVNPPAGSVFMWHTLDGSNNLVINYRLPDGTDKTFTAGDSGGGISAAVFKYQLASGNNTGADVTADQFNTVPLAVTEANTITGASLSNGQVTLPAGTYIATGIVIKGTRPSTQLSIYNITDSAEIANSGIGYEQAESSAMSSVKAMFTLADTKVIEFQIHPGNETYKWGPFAAPQTNRRNNCDYATLEILKIG
jgi:hypothetical protein